MTPQSSTPSKNQARDATLVSSEEASETAVLYDKQFETDLVALKGLYESLPLLLAASLQNLLSSRDEVMERLRTPSKTTQSDLINWGLSPVKK
jgi:hypothetical protein